MAKKPKSKSETAQQPVTQDVVEAEIVETPVEEPVPEAAVVVEPPKRSGIGVVALGVVALLAGGALVYFLQPAPIDNQAEIDRLSAQIEALSTEVSKPETDLAAQAVDRLEGALAQELGGLGSTIGGLAQQLAEVDARMAELENQPAPGTPVEVSDALQGLRSDISSWQAEAERLRSENTLLAQMIEDRDAELTETAAEIASLQDQLAQAQAVQSASVDERLAGVIAQIEVAVETGQPFENAALQYADVSGEQLPKALMPGSDGIATEQDLQTAFPDVARATLAAVLAENSGAGTLSRIGDFARSQVGLRSVVAREGDNPDAVLSRAQAAVDTGDFGQALGELADLKASGPELARWIATAEQRQAAVTAINELKGVTQ